MAYAQTAPAPVPAADQPKWQPYVSVGGQVGGQSGDTVGGVHVTAFAPVWQDLNSMLFVRFGAGTQTNDGVIGNFGLGYRTKIDNDWIAGVFAGVDSTQTKFNNTFWQGSVGAEAMSPDWDVRLNGYIATQMKPRDISGAYSLFIQDTRIAILGEQESAYSGFDGEVGYRVFNTDNLDLRVFAGGFDFTHDSSKVTLSGRTFNLGPGDLAGPVGRVELDLYNIDMLGSQSRLIVSGTVSHDDVRGTSGYAGVALHIPLGDTDAPDQDDLDRRMIDPVRRQDNVLAESGFSRPEPVILSNGHITSQPTNTVYYVDNTAGAGTYADPTTLHDATARGPVNQFIVLTDRDGSHVDATGVYVQHGETVTNPGIFTIKGAVSGVTFTHDFAPHSGPVTVNTADGIRLGSNTNLFGFTIDSTAPNAIYGHNVNNVVISGVTVTGSGAAGNGIYILDDNGTSSTVKIENTTITGVLADGISLVVDNGTGSTATDSFNLTNVTVNAGGDGVALSTHISGTSNQAVYLGVHDSSLTAGGTALSTTAIVNAGSTLNSLTVVDPTHLVGGEYGLFVFDKTIGGGLADTIVLDHVYVTGATESGININGYAAGGIVTQTVSMNHVTVDGSRYPIAIYAGADHGLMQQTVSMNDVSATNGYYDNIKFIASANDGAITHQYVTGTDITATGATYGDGLFGSAGAYDHSTTVQSIAIDGLTATGNYYYGAFFAARAQNGASAATSSVTQNVSLSNATITGNGYGGVGEFGSALYQGATHQDLDVENSTITGNFGFGAYARAIGAGGSATQHLELVYDTITNNSGDGVYVGASAYDAGTVHQTAYLYSDAVTHSSRNGIDIRGRAAYASQVQQDVGVYYVDVSHSGTNGLYAFAGALDGSTTIQHITSYGLTASNNRTHGVQLVAYGSDNTTSDSNVVGQYASFAFATIDNNTRSAVAAEANSSYFGTAIRQDLAVRDSDLSGNGGAGVYATVGAGFYSSAEQNITLVGDTIQNNATSGVYLQAYAHALGSIHQTAYLANDTITGNGQDGIYVGANAVLAGQVLQDVGIYNVDASNNVHDGLDVVSHAYGYGVGSYAAYFSHIGQNITAEYSNFSYSGHHGVEVQNYAGYGAQTNQFVYLYNDRMDHNTVSGFYEKSVAQAFGVGGFPITTNLYSDVYIVSSSASYNGVDGMHIEGTATGPTYMISHITVDGTTAYYNGRDGFSASATAHNYYSLNIQYVTLANSHFDHNGANGASFNAYQNYGPLSFGAAIQDVTLSGSTFSHNAADGLYAHAGAYLQQGRAEQHFTIQNSTFDDNGLDGAEFQSYAGSGTLIPGFTCDVVQGLQGGCAFVRQTIQILGSEFNDNTFNGIAIQDTAQNYGAVYNSSGRPANTPTLLMEYSTASGNGLDGLYIDSTANANGFVYSYAVLLGSSFDHNGRNGIDVNSTVSGGGEIVQKTVLYGLPGAGTTANYNAADGLHVTSTSTGGTIQQAVGVYYSHVYGNSGAGVSVDASANSVAAPTAIVAQYVNVLYSEIAYNGGHGISLTERATGPYAITQQSATIAYDFIGYNGGDGVHAFEVAYAGAAANQYLKLESDTILNNTGNGVYVASTAVDQAATQQTLNFDYHAIDTSYVGRNGGDGIYVSASAFSGASAQQNVFLYGVNSGHNDVSGLAINANANGYGFGSAYIYYSHVSQNLIAAYESFDYNRNGIAITDNAYYGGAMNQFIGLYGLDVSHNAGPGIYEKATLTSVRGNSFAFSTNMTNMLYINNSTIDHNAGNGIDLRSYNNGATYHPAFFGGYSYLIQHTHVVGSDVSDNQGDGLFATSHEQGRYGLNAQYFVVANSTFTQNAGDGARFESIAFYGPGSFGDVYANIQISGSHFDDNRGNGLSLYSEASGTQGRAEQHVTVGGSSFDHNNGDGVSIYASAVNGTYIAGHPCDTVQGLPGGCAFVRQSVVIQDSDISYNGNNGVHVVTYANNYGAIYGVSGRPHSPTLNLYGDTVDGNQSRGLDVSNHVAGGSYLYQYIAAVDTHFDHNNADGIYSSSYAGGGSTSLQRDLLYAYHTGASAMYNAGNGFKSTIEALGGSYARDVNIVQGAYIDHNGSFGFDGAVAYADAASTGLQINSVYFNGIDHNGDGVGLYSIGAGAQQISYIGGNYIVGNSSVGVYGDANFGAFQYIGVYTFGNNVHDNGTDYLFNAFGGATQILN